MTGCSPSSAAPLGVPGPAGGVGKVGHGTVVVLVLVVLVLVVGPGVGGGTQASVSAATPAATAASIVRQWGVWFVTVFLPSTLRVLSRRALVSFVPGPWTHGRAARQPLPAVAPTGASPPPSSSTSVSPWAVFSQWLGAVTSWTAARSAAIDMSTQ